MSQINIPSSISVKEFAKRLDKSVSDVIKILMDNGFLVTINEDLDYDVAAIVAEDLGFEVQKEEEPEELAKTPFELAEILNEEKKKVGKGRLKDRPPVVTILGHVDHGKTTLLDTIRKTKVAEGESGGITQHITAYQVKVKNKLITFVDTPGHEAFQKMRMRGANIADIAILIIAADDGVKPQTKEVLTSVQEAKLPYIICLNKIDKPEANAEKVKGQLAEAGVLVEGWGGKIPIVAISAKANKNVDELLETVLLVAEIEELGANYERPAVGLVLESHLDKRRGPMATIIVKSGTLREGDYFVAGNKTGRARLMEDFGGRKIELAAPSTPVVVLGANSLPEAGSVFQVVLKKDSLKQRKQNSSPTRGGTGHSVLKRIEKSLEKGKYKKLNVVVKADTQGSLEAIEQILETLVIDDVVVGIVKGGVGQITESDIVLAKISNAILYGFRVSQSLTALEIGEKENWKARLFDVIYRLVEDIQAEMKKIVTMEEVKVDHGVIKVLAIFRTSKKDMIIGGRVVKGKVMKGDLMEIKRGEEVLGKGRIAQMKRGKDEVNESVEGEECGITYEAEGPLVRIQEGDEVLTYALDVQTKTITDDDTK